MKEFRWGRSNYEAEYCNDPVGCVQIRERQTVKPSDCFRVKRRGNIKQGPGTGPGTGSGTGSGSTNGPWREFETLCHDG